MENYFRDLSKAEIERLIILSGECSEVIKVINKAIQFGWKPTFKNKTYNNREDLEMEIGHVLNAMDILYIEGDILEKNVLYYKINKYEEIQGYLRHQKSK